MNHLQGTTSKYPRCDFTFTKRRPLILLHGIRGMGWNAVLSLISSILMLLLASPANSQLAPDASATAAVNGRSPVAVSDPTDIAKEAGKVQPGAVGTDIFNLTLSEAQALKGAQTLPGEDEQALRRELAAARAELARQAQALKEQQQTDETLTLNLETAQRAIENFRAEASLWDSKKGAMPEAHPSTDASQAAANQALDEERHKGELLGQELATARQTIDALKTGANLAVAEQAKGVKDRQVADAAANQALDEERHKGELLEQELATARQTIDALKTGASMAAMEQAKAVKDRQAADAAATQALDDERHKVELLEQELATARQTIDALKASANLAVAEQAKAAKDRQVADAASNQTREALELERQRADSAMRDLDSARKERDALKQSSIDLSAALDQERERANGLARSLSAAREEIDSIKDKRRTAAVVRAPKAGTPKTALASSLPRAVALPARKPGLPKKRKVKGPKSPQPVLLATIALPAALLPTRPLSP
ncbi:hypothetical protein DBIPINDM_004992 [Mesorhizobium sp. AR02]|uniref:hypothetical protein n=1 Tax=Mesorhizobium sp. AR02 TaxID=2865837 RepID=UPI00215FF8DE|nr:hypothetical protein [Mesorhizobium sp. AR02]UVK51691.1 hypothetical protein DBIPINDM_004992 [Mesorhizobium sp. AR02]